MVQLRNDLNKYIEEILLGNEDPFLSQGYLKELINVHQRGFSNLGKKLFTVLMFELWWEQYGK